MFNHRLLNVVIALVLLTVLVLTIQEAIATSSIVADVESASRSLYASNPELKAVDRYSSIAPSASDQLTTNPELSVAHRYSELNMGVRISQAINPELSAASRFAASTNRSDEPASLSTNPELSAARRFAAKRAGK